MEEEHWDLSLRVSIPWIDYSLQNTDFNFQRKSQCLGLHFRTDCFSLSDHASVVWLIALGNTDFTQGAFFFDSALIWFWELFLSQKMLVQCRIVIAYLSEDERTIVRLVQITYSNLGLYHLNTFPQLPHPALFQQNPSPKKSVLRPDSQSVRQRNYSIL